MNRIFKIVYNHLMGRHVVVSEVAGGVQRGTCRLVASAVMALAGLGVSSSAVAVNMGYSFDAGVVLDSKLNSEGNVDLSVDVIRGDWYGWFGRDYNEPPYTYGLGQWTYTDGNISGATETTTVNGVSVPTIRKYIWDEYQAGHITKSDFEKMVQDLDNASTAPLPSNSGQYVYSVFKQQGTAGISNTFEHSIFEAIPGVLLSGQNAAVTANDYQTTTVTVDGQQITVYVDSTGQPLKDGDGNYITDKTEIPNKEGSTEKNAIVSEYGVAAIDSKVVNVTSDGPNDAGTTTYTIVQSTGEFTENSDGTYNYKDKTDNFTFTDTNTTINSVAVDGNAVTLKDSSGTQLLKINGGDDFTVEAVTGEDGETVVGAKVSLKPITYRDDTDTTYTVEGKGGTGNVVNTYTLKAQNWKNGDKDGEESVVGTIKDTDTRYTLSGGKDGETAADGSTTYKINLQDQSKNAAGAAEFVDTNSVYDARVTVEDGSASFEAFEGKIEGEGDLTTLDSLTVKQGNNVTITAEGEGTAVISKKDTTLDVNAGSPMSFGTGDESNHLKLNLKDTAGTPNAVTGSVDLSKYIGKDTNNRYTAQTAMETAGEVTAANAGKGWASIGLYNGKETEKGTEADGDAIATLKIQAGENVVITKGGNGEAVINAIDTNTTYSIATPGGETGNQVKIYQLVETPHTNGVAGEAKNLEPVIIDTDTKYELAGGKEGETADDGTTTYKISLTSPNGGKETSATVYDTNTTYKLEQTTEDGADYGDGSTTLTFTGSDGTSQSATLTAGDNVKIVTDGYGAAIIAKDTTYTHEVTDAGLAPGQISKLTITEVGSDKDPLEFYDTDTRNTVVKGNNITVEETPQADGSIQYTINGKDTVLKEGENVSIKAVTDQAKGVTTYTVSTIADGPANINFNGDTGNTIETPETLNIQGGIKEASELTDDENPNIGVVSDGKGTLKVKLAKDLKGLETVEVKNSVTVGGNTTINQEGMTISGAGDKGDQTIKITKTEVNMGGNVIHNVAPGKLDDDAVNVSQLRQFESGVNTSIDHLNDRIGEVAKDANAGIAMALAAASLPQAILPGKSMVSVAGASYRGEQGYALGFSIITDSGKWMFKADATTNSRSNYGASVSVGYLW